MAQSGALPSGERLHHHPHPHEKHILHPHYQMTVEGPSVQISVIQCRDNNKTDNMRCHAMQAGDWLRPFVINCRMKKCTDKGRIDGPQCPNGTKVPASLE